MSLAIPNGASVAIASTYGALKTMSALSNANPAVATLEASHGVIVNDIVEVTSGWGRLDGRIARASVVATNDVTLEGINTASTTNFPAGSGIGSVREISAWTDITQILNVTRNGGEQQFVQFQTLDSRDQKQKPTVRSAMGFTFTLGDDSTLPWYAVIDAADLAGTPSAMRITLPNGAKLYYNAIWSINKTPSLDVNQIMGLQVTASLVAEQTRYSS